MPAVSSIPITNIPSETASTQKAGLAYPEFVVPVYLPAAVRTATRLGLSQVTGNYDVQFIDLFLG
jgi:hypothetical protein